MKEVNVDSIGLYFASLEGGLRLSLDAVHLFAGQINKGIIEINDSQTEQWFKGKNTELNEKQKSEIENFKGNFVILKNENDFIGVGKKSSHGITNFMPKERRVKN